MSACLLFSSTIYFGEYCIKKAATETFKHLKTDFG